MEQMTDLGVCAGMNKISLVLTIFWTLCCFQTGLAQKALDGKKPVAVCNGYATNLPDPDFVLPIDGKYSGEISVQVLINENGSVESAIAVSGPPFLRSAAEKAAVKAQFRTNLEPSQKVNCSISYVVRPTPFDDLKAGNRGSSNDKPQICDGGIVNRIATYFPQPDYPDEAKKKHISGVVAVRVSIDEDGNVISVKSCSGHPLLRAEAEKAAKKAKFKPTRLSGQAVKVVGILVYDFSMNEERFVKGGIINGRATFLPKPVYPKEAEDLCVGGQVEVAVDIAFDNSVGKVISAKAVSGDELLRESAEEAALRAAFRKQDDVDEKRLAGIIVYNFEPEVKCITIGIVNNKSIYLPQPDVSDMIQYKYLQLKSKQIVAVQIIVNTEGKVMWAKAIAGNPLLRAVCENSARQSRFDPVNDVDFQFKVKALLAYKFKPDGMVETHIELDDRDVIGTPIDLVKPPPPFCNCRFGGNSNVFVKARIDGKGDVTDAEALNGHPILKNISEKAALESKFLPTNFRAEVLIVYKFDAINNYREVRLSDIYVKEVKVENPIIIGHAPPNTQPIYSPQPEFPAAAKLVGVSGEVKVEILIDVNGNVEDAKAVSGNPLLRSAAVKAARQTKFKPMTLSGTPVKVRSLIVYDFKP